MDYGGVIPSKRKAARSLSFCIFTCFIFWVSDQRLTKWFGESCHIFELSLYLNWAMPISLPASIVLVSARLVEAENLDSDWCLQLFKYNIVLSPCYHKICLSYLRSIENPPNVHLGNFWRHWKWLPLIAYKFVGFTILKR